MGRAKLESIEDGGDYLEQGPLFWVFSSSLPPSSGFFRSFLVHLKIPSHARTKKKRTKTTYQPRVPRIPLCGDSGNPSFPRRRPPSALPSPSPPPRATAGQSPGSAGGGGASPWRVLLSPPGGGASYPGGGLAAWSSGLRATGDRRRPDLSLPSGTPLRLRASRPLLRQSTSGLQPSTAPRLTAPVLHLRQSGTASVAAVDCISVGLHLRQEAGEEQGERGVVDEGSVVSTCSLMLMCTWAFLAKLGLKIRCLGTWA